METITYCYNNKMDAIAKCRELHGTLDASSAKKSLDSIDQVIIEISHLKPGEGLEVAFQVKFANTGYQSQCVVDVQIPDENAQLRAASREETV